MPDPLPVLKRHRLPDHRPSLTHRRDICGYKCYITVSFFDGHNDDRLKPAEMFVKVAKHGSTMAGLIDGLTAVISTSLQYGVPWEAIKDKLLHHNFERNGDPENSSILDGLAKAVDQIIVERRGIIGDDPPSATAVVTTDPNLGPKSPIVEALAEKMPVQGAFGGPRVRIIIEERRATFEDGSECTLTTDGNIEWKPMLRGHIFLCKCGASHRRGPLLDLDSRGHQYRCLNCGNTTSMNASSTSA